MSVYALTADVLVPENLGGVERKDKGLSALVLGRAAGSSGKGSLPRDPQSYFDYLSAVAAWFCCDTSYFGKIPSSIYVCRLQRGGVVVTAQFSERNDGLGAHFLAPGCFGALPGSCPLRLFSKYSISGNRTSFCWRECCSGLGLAARAPVMAGSMFALDTSIRFSRGRVCPPTALAQAVGLSRREWVIFLGIFLLVVSRHPSRVPAQCSETEDLVSGNGRLEIGHRSVGQRGEQKTGVGNSIIIAVTIG